MSCLATACKAPMHFSGKALIVDERHRAVTRVGMMKSVGEVIAGRHSVASAHVPSTMCFVIPCFFPLAPHITIRV